MKTMWIFTQPVKQRFLSRRICRVADGASVSVVIFVAEIFRVKTSRWWRAVPGPMGRGTERKLIFAFSRKGLQSGHIRSEGEFAVADGERGKRIKLRYLRIMPADKCTPVHAAGQISQCGQGGRREQQARCTRGLEELSAVQMHELFVKSLRSILSFQFLHLCENRRLGANNSSFMNYQRPYNSPNC